MSDELKKTGVSLVAEGAAQFKSDVDGASETLGRMGEAAQGGGEHIDILGEIATGALRKIGELVTEGVIKLGESLVDFVKDAMEGEKLLARLTSVITATGNAAGLTVEGAQNLANQFKDLAGGSDEAVLAIEEMALRMGTVSADQMPNFIQTTLDLAAATGQDATNAARLLAQAYDDPASALTRFNKMGIRFDADLSQQIKDLVKAGKTGDAYALMMERLGKATAGAAAGQANTLAGQIGIMQEHLADAGKAIGEAFLPILKTLFDEVVKPAIPIVEGFATSIADAVSVLDGSYSPIEALTTVLGNALISLEDISPIFGELGNNIIGSSGGITSAIQPIIDAFGNIGAAFQASLPMIEGVVLNMVTFVQQQFATMSPTLIANVSSMLNSLAKFWTDHGAQIMAIIDIAFKFISTTIGGALTLISGIIAAALQIINGDWSGAWNTILATLGTFFQLALNIVGVNLADFLAQWNFIFASIVTLVQVTLTDMLVSVGQWFIDFIKTWQDNFAAFLLIVTTLIDRVKFAWNNIDWPAIGKNIIEGIKAGIMAAANALAEAAANAASAALNAAKHALGIESPSTAFAEVGRQMMAGMALGIDQNASIPGAAAAGAAINTISSTLSVTNNYNYSPSYGGAPYAPSTDFAIMQVMAG